ncbi:response regulator transcription factor [Nocardioides sp. SR21]|uniref:helix-turn-helix transcriptional regulator n=1 Tax=Nocardioides sp. SR21 TaxID=2919501 RepID=UPI001FA9CEDB|nr:response regulator transcription factor [Nocardioides sp. SR21]
MSVRPPRVGIVSSQEVLGKGLAAMLAEHPDRAVLTDADRADVVLYDVLGVHRTNGADLEHLVQQTTSVILAVSRDLRPDLRARALAGGAHGWVSMSVDSAQLVEAVEAAVDGRTVPGRDDRLGHAVGLTEREVEVLALITLGMSNQEIADRLYLSINSVKTYVRTAYAKIGARSRSHAVAWCLHHGFAPPEL